MLLAILMFVIIAGGGSLIVYIRDREYADYDGFIVAGILLWVLTLIISTVIWNNNNKLPIDINNPISCVECYGVNDVVGVDGHFALGSGSVESEIYIFYYVKGEFGGYKISKTEANDVEVIEREDDEPIAYLKTYEQKSKFNLFFSIGSIVEHKQIIFVPKGTIKVNFNIDLAS